MGGAGTKLPLTGLRVCDFGWVWAAPALTQFLADFGADVIKIETSRRLDLTRMMPYFLHRDVHPNNGTLFHSLNRNKRAITLDLRRPKAQTIARRLASLSDIVVENFTPRVMRTYGLTYDDLCPLKPDLIMASLSAAGQFGSLRDTVTYGPALGGLAGIESLTGYLGEEPCGLQIAYSDPTAGMIGTFAVLAALEHRERTGQGQYIDLSQWEATTSLIPFSLLDYLMNGRVAGPQGNREPAMAPHGCYPTQGENRYVTIAIRDDTEWTAFCAALGYPSWTADPRFADGYRRKLNEDALDEKITEWTRQRTNQDVTELLQGAGVAAFPSSANDEFFNDPHWQARGTWAKIDHPVRAGVTIAGVPWHLSDTPGSIREPAPLLGEDNETVLSELLGLTRSEIQDLADAEVLL